MSTSPINLPLFSVLVPVYNHDRYIGLALDSLLTQTDPDWEAVVVNDGSTDNTAAIVDDYARRDARIRVFHKANGGVSSALNRGLAEARGQWICWLSSDDLFEPDKLAIHREWITKFPATRFHFTRHRELDQATGVVSDAALWRDIPEVPWQALEMLRCTFVHGNSICIHREAWNDVGLFDESLRSGQDFDMWLRLLARYAGVFIPEFTCITRCHALQGTHGFPEACFYDSARACLRLLNERRLDELIPGVDLTSEPELAIELARRAAEIAQEASIFAYKLGAHVALIGRLLEWVLVNAPATVRDEALRVVRAVADRTARQHPDDWLGLYWRTAQAGLVRGAIRYDYRPVDWVTVAVRARDYALARKRPDWAPLQRYLERMDGGARPRRGILDGSRFGITVVVSAPGTEIGSRVKYGTSRATMELTRGLVAAGVPSLVTGIGRPGVADDHDVATWSALDERLFTKGLRAMGCVDVAIGVSRADVAAWVRARRYTVVHHDSCPPFGMPVSLINLMRLPVAVVSDWARRRQVKNGLRPSLLHVVWNGIDGAIYHADTGGLRHAHRIAFVGALFDYKGFDVALRAFEIIRSEFGDAELILAGCVLPWEGKLDLFRESWLSACGNPNWSAITRDVPGVRYVGELDPIAVADVLRSASILVAPSQIEETFGLVSVEAQACGCIPVLPRAGGFPETMEAGCTGVLYSPNTLEALASTVVALWRDREPSDAMRSASVQWAKGRYSWENTTRGVLNIVAGSQPVGLGGRILGGAVRVGTGIARSRLVLAYRWRLSRVRTWLSGRMSSAS